ncbi:hypothetical protein VP277E431_P0151 [Vibrio phage 277E43-1]|nr:hypothetical protein VP277E431_P0151 [Vibrio phage 277E43-1]
MCLGGCYLRLGVYNRTHQSNTAFNLKPWRAYHETHSNHF